MYARICGIHAMFYYNAEHQYLRIIWYYDVGFFLTLCDIKLHMLLLPFVAPFGLRLLITPSLDEYGIRMKLLVGILAALVVENTSHCRESL